MQTLSSTGQTDVYVVHIFKVAKHAETESK